MYIHNLDLRIIFQIFSQLSNINIHAAPVKIGVASPYLLQGRFAGQKVKVRMTDPVEGRRNFSGTIRGAGDGAVEIDCDGRCCQLPVDAIARAHLVPDWEAEFRRGGEGPGGGNRGNRPTRSVS